jgi:hypothetical protein
VRSPAARFGILLTTIEGRIAPVSLRQWAVASASFGSAVAFFVVFVFVAAACSQEPRVRLRVEPPRPISAPVDPVDIDRDGFFDDADPCPAAAEDGAEPSPEDGCPVVSDAGAGDAGLPTRGTLH